jgi:hypothetical protein
MDTIARPNEECRGVVQTLLFVKKMHEDMLTKPLSRAHARAGILGDPGVEMSNTRTNLPERPDEPMTLGLGRGIIEDASNPTSGHGKPLHLNV